MHPILFKFGSITIFSYGFMIALAFLAGIYFSYFLAVREGIKGEKIFDLALVILVSSIVGARIFYVIEFWPDFISNPLEVFFIWQGGLVFFGGLLFAALAAVAFANYYKIKALKLMDIITPGTALGYGIGRIGCFLRGCCYGIETKLPWGIVFPGLSEAHHPTQLYAFISGIIMFTMLLLLYRKKKYDGQVFFSGLMFYSVYRFSVEFLRMNPKYLFFSMAQWISILIFFLALQFMRRERGHK
ncbi:MAG: phosphatidylglycerol:prolipoprotein diacylglycerol transferase [Candidatus Saganbacteria bacterium]|uniref:Phosphatidylglycerol--prolipoprotein diacylglyceryl transferase n=1 Tax=Candidatus Saganbacteria bacterium TaxID=2575572 RepID=A0A833NYD3_UNCSA|nr:MAG: phosphatidylglycerol:prolipoprotein diacylglycerol transferase [Candidatus Saganbacteria bacterium]